MKKEEKRQNSKEEKAEETRQKYLKDIKYTSDEKTYSLKFEGKEYTFRGFPTITDKAKIRAILNTIAPHSLGMPSDRAIYGSGDHFLQALSTGIAYSNVLLISPDDFDPDKFCLDKNGESDEGRYSNFGLSILMAEIEFQKTKKKPL